MDLWNERLAYLFTFLMLLLSVGLSAGGAALSAPQNYTVEDLGTLGGNYSVATAINNAGQVSGTSATVEGRDHAFRYTPGIGIEDLGALSDDSDGISYGHRINELGHVVGPSYNSRGRYHAFVYREQGIIDLDGNPFGQSNAFGINNTGSVVGATDSTIRGEFCAAWWHDDQLERVTPCIGGSRTSVAVAINDSDQLVYKTCGRGALVCENAFRRQADGSETRLGDLGGRDIHPQAINAAGQVVGLSTTAQRLDHAFRYTDEFGLEDLSPGFEAATVAYGLNNVGQIVGKAAAGVGAFLYTEKEGMRRLNDLVKDPTWVLQIARGINDAGQIVGTGLHNGVTRAFLLTPLFKEPE